MIDHFGDYKLYRGCYLISNSEVSMMAPPTILSAAVKPRRQILGGAVNDAWRRRQAWRQILGAAVKILDGMPPRMPSQQ